MPMIAGADGCAAGWIVISRDVGEGKLSATVVTTTELVAFAESATVLTVDIPIGLTDRGRRVCDDAARVILGWPRRNSVFPTPIRPALEAANRAEASAVKKLAAGRGVSTQSWAPAHSIALSVNPG